MAAPTCLGLIQVSEGERLAALARFVPPERAIVEIGTHTGLSTCWMAGGAKAGLGAHISAVDPWRPPRPDTLEDPFELGSEVYAQFARNVSAEGHWGAITPLRATSLQAARLWVQPVGLLFIDAVHTYQAVKADYEAWRRHVPVGGWLAFHDYTLDPAHPYAGVARFVDSVISASGAWSVPEVTEYLWTAQRLTPEDMRID